MKNGNEYYIILNKILEFIFRCVPTHKTYYIGTNITNTNILL